MNNKNEEQSKITLAIAFIGTYLTVIFAFPEKIKIPSENALPIDELFWGIFILMGSLIIAFFFLYLLFAALELDDQRSNVTILGQPISDKKIKNIKQFLFHSGINFIGLSFMYVVYYALYELRDNFNIWLALLIWIPCVMLLMCLSYLVFRDK